MATYSPLPKNPVCDFCNDPNVVHSYDASDCELPEFPVIGSEGGWAACQICKDYIDSEDWAGLEARSVYSFIQTHSLSVRELQTFDIRHYIQSIHMLFRTHRKK